MILSVFVLPLVATCHAIKFTNVVNTTYGPIVGLNETETQVFRNIPYGADTSTTRFKPPKPPAPWKETKTCTEFGNIAPQPWNVSLTGRVQSEDCLNLNIYTSDIDDGKRPVLVWLHPGGYEHQTSNDELYDGRNLSSKRNCVVVTISHRLNGFGYMYLGKISPEYELGNAGQLDIILALKWIKDNIHLFGGDKESITLFGQSGGGAKISTLMAMPAAKALFHKVWTMSGQQITGRTQKHAEETTQAVFSKIKGNSWEEKLKLLQTMSMNDLRSLMVGSGISWTPVVDGITLPRDPFSPTAPDLSRDIPMVMGNTYDETRNLIGSSKGQLFKLTWEEVPLELEKNVRQFLGNLSTEDIVARYRKNYPKYSPSDVFFAATTAARSWKSMLVEAEVRARQDNGAPLWVYYFNWKSPYEEGKWGAAHGFDVPFIFANPASTMETKDFPGTDQISDWLSRALVYFAKDGRPQVPRTDIGKNWPPYTLEDRKALVFDNFYVELVSDDRGWERKLFENVPYVQPGT